MTGFNPVGLSQYPTAHSPVADVPPIPVSVLSLVVAPSLGLANRVHVPPDACSTSVRRTPLGVVRTPTAQALVFDRVSTLVKTVLRVKFLGESNFQLAPCQRNAT